VAAAPLGATAVSSAPLITVCTPTYDRARTLPRLHESLCAQTFRDFEWLVVDDGSTDDTADVVAGLAGRSPFPVVYRRQENAGKHIALNHAVAACRGTFLAVVDSDDWYVPSCLERLKRHWDAIPDPRDFAEVQGLCADEHGRVLGDPYPADVFDSDYYTLTQVLRLRGDRSGMIRVDILRAHPFPEEFRGVYVPEAIVWNRIARRYRIRGVNEVVTQKEYLATGITSTGRDRAAAWAGPRFLHLAELVDLAETRGLPRSEKLRAYANLTRYGLHDRRRLGAIGAAAPDRALWAATLPLGAALYLRDRV
jgi:glycosyltransferase involved in cell wall biosynthesis